MAISPIEQAVEVNECYRLFTPIVPPSHNQGHRKGELAIMRFASVGITLLLISVLSGQEQKKEKFSDCDKSSRTQADLTECAGSDLKSADDELNATYQQLLKKAAGDAVALRKIKAAQRAWVVFRDAQMAAFYPAEEKQKEYGSVFPMCADLLLADLTRERTKMLKEMLNSVEGDVCASGISR